MKKERYTNMKTNKQLKDENPELYKVAREGGTESAFSGKYVNEKTDGMYHCAVCDAPLFSSDTKFDSKSGWPSFTQPEVKESVTLHSDDILGIRRTEVRCTKCEAHLGHVFPDGPKKDGKTCDRYCINSVSLELKPKEQAMQKEIILGGGCFWGLEELFRKQPGVIETEVGYAGGFNEHPTYENHPGHAEVLRIVYDAKETNLRSLLMYFFKIHNPTTINQQGNDVGTSYRSVIFYTNDEDKKEAEVVIDEVDESGKWSDPVVTVVEPLKNYFPAEEMHQNYLQKNPGGYTCHFER